MLFPQYEAQYGVGSFIYDYKQIYYEDFYAKLYALKGDYGEILASRDAYLNRKETKDNRDRRKLGRKLITEKQKEEMKQRSLELRQNENNDEYFLKQGEDILKMKGLR